MTDDKLDRVEALIAWAASAAAPSSRSRSAAWPPRTAVACVIAGATTPEQVKANAAAAEWVPSAEDLAGLDRVVPPPARS